MNIVRILEKKKREIEFSSSTLKLIAIITMIIDHIGLMLIYNGKLYGYDASLLANAIVLPEAKKWVIFYKICRYIGRFSFPIFALLLVEGFRKTENLFKYIIRIFILALVSEVPFNLMCFNKFMCFDKQNVIFTYLIGLLMLITIKASRNFSFFLNGVALIVASIGTFFLKTDYALEGIALIFIFYVFRHNLFLKCIIASIILFLASFEKFHGFAILSIFFIYFYNEQKGFLNLKKFSYVIYPLHMIILYLIVYFSYRH